MDIKSSGREYPILSSFELTKKELKELDYIEDIESASFVRYKRWVYDLGEVMKAPPELEKLGWHGATPDSAFSGVLFKYTDDNETLIMATYYS